MNWFFFTVAAILILGFSALFAAPYFVNWDDYRDLLEAEAARVLGREVKVAGKVDMRFLPAPFVRFRDVTIAGAEGAEGESFLETKTFTMWLAISPLVGGTLEAREMQIEEARLNLKFDRDGKPNWADMASSGDRLAWMPENVELKAVNIVNSSIFLSPGENSPQVKITNLNGEFSARSLQGPFRFSGRWGAEKALKDIRLSTGEMKADGDMAIRSVIHVPATGATYNFDGVLDAKNGAPHYAGVFSATVPPLVKVETLVKPEEGAPAPGKVEFKSALDVTLKRALMNSIVVTYESESRPQLINGEAVVDWDRGVSVDGRVNTKLIDLDQMLSGGAGVAKPADILSLVREFAQETGPLVDRASIRAEIEQTSLGGELVQSVDLHLVKSGDGSFELSSMKAELPGKNALSLSGKLALDAEHIGFKGPVSIKGENLPKLIHWLGLGAASPTVRSVGSYGLTGNALFAPEKIEFTGVEGAFDGSAIKGSFRYGTGPRTSYQIELDSEAIDFTKLFGDEASIKTVRELLVGDTTSNSEEAGQIFGLPAGIDADVNMRVGKANLKNFNGRDVVINARYTGDQFVVRDFNIASGSGLKMKASGTLKQDETGHSSGSLKMALNAEAQSEVKLLSEMLGVSEEFGVGSDSAGSGRLASLVPLKLDVTLDTGAGRDNAKKGANALVLGKLGNTDVKAKMAFSKGFSNFKTSDLSVSGTLGAEDPLSLLSVVAGVEQDGLAAPATETAELKAGDLRFQVNGVPETGMKADIRLKAAGLDASFDGAVRFDDNGSAADGALKLKSASSALVMSLFGAKSASGGDIQPISMSGTLKKLASVYVFDAVKGKWGDAHFKGDVRADFAKTPVLVDAGVGISEASLPDLLGFLVAPSGNKLVERAETMVDETSEVSYWAKHSFARNALSGMTGDVRLGVGILDIAPKVSVKTAGVVASFKEGGLDVSLVNGTLFGGAATSDLAFVKTGGGVKLTGTLALTDAKLEALTAANTGAPLASGPLRLTMEFEGQGLSPQGIVTVLTGKGSAGFGEGKIYKLSSKALPGLVDALAKKPNKGALAEDLSKRLKKGAFAYPAMAVPLEIAHGALRLGDIEIAQDRTRAEVQSSIVLTSLKLNSHWRLSVDAKEGSEALPPVKLSFSGALDQFGSLKPDINTQLLERYLTVERMERDVQRLEDLERKDRQRIQQEKRLEEQRRLQREEARRREEELRRRQLELQRQQLSPQELPGSASAPSAGVGGPSPTLNGAATINQTRPAMVDGGGVQDVQGQPLETMLLPSRPEGAGPNGQAAPPNWQPQGQNNIQQGGAAGSGPNALDQDLLPPLAAGDVPLSTEVPTPEVAPAPVVKRKKDPAPNVFGNPLNPFAN